MGNGGNEVAKQEPLKVSCSLPRGEIRDCAAKGDESVLPQVCEFLDKHPAAVEYLGNLTRMARSAMIETISGDDLYFREAQERKIRELTEKIAGPCPSMLEQLLADQIALCWQQVREHEMRWTLAREHTYAAADYYQRCIDRAQRRYLNAIKTLAQVRRLQLPAVQLNGAGQGGKQVNIAAQ